MRELSDYEKRADAQLEAWVEGRVYHEPINDECAPDFSCCMPELFTKDRVKREELAVILRRNNDFPLAGDGK